MAYPPPLEFVLKFHFLELLGRPLGLVAGLAVSAAVVMLVVWRVRRRGPPGIGGVVLAWLPLVYTVGALGLLSWLGVDPSVPNTELLRYASVPAFYLGMFLLGPLIVLAVSVTMAVVAGRRTPGTPA